MQMAEIKPKKRRSAMARITIKSLKDRIQVLENALEDLSDRYGRVTTDHYNKVDELSSNHHNELREIFLDHRTDLERADRRHEVEIAILTARLEGATSTAEALMGVVVRGGK
jgi:hypothetical protein